MSCKESVKSIFLVLISLTITMLPSCGGNDMHPPKALNSLSKLIETESFDDLSLTIYYMSPFTLTLKPVSETDLVDSCDYKVTISGYILEEYDDLLNQILDADMSPVEEEIHLNARVYYVFETKKEGNIFSVSMWGADNSMCINGIWIKENSAFYDIIMPFLPKNAGKELQSYIEENREPILPS